MNKKNNVRPFSMKDKIGYTLGDLGCCFTEQYRAMYLSVFYTLVLQVNPFHVGILMLITKIWDAINDPIIGAIVDLISNGCTLHIRICECQQFELRFTFSLYVYYLRII